PGCGNSSGGESGTCFCTSLVNSLHLRDRFFRRSDEVDGLPAIDRTLYQSTLCRLVSEILHGDQHVNQILLAERDIVGAYGDVRAMPALIYERSVPTELRLQKPDLGGNLDVLDVKLNACADRKS